MKAKYNSPINPKYDHIRKLGGCLLVVFITATLLAACSKKEKTGLTVGLSLPLSGPAASYGEAAQKGVQIAYDSFIASHPELKGMIVIDIQDDMASPKDAISVYQKFRAAGVRIYLGPMVSGAALAVTELAKNDNALFILPTATTPQLRGRSPLIYRTCVSDDAEGSAVAEFALKRTGQQALAILHINNDYGLGVSKVFEDTFRKNGGNVVFNEAYEASATDFRDITTKIRASIAAATFIVGQKEQTQLIKQLRESGFTGQIYGTTMFEDPQLIESPASAGAIFSTRVLEDGSGGADPHPLFAEFSKRFGGNANYYTAAFYDGTMVALHCAAELLQHPKSDLIGLPRTVNLKQGATGSLQFDDKNDVMQPFSFKIITNGKTEIMK